jgi:hypothetical protein
MTTYKGILKHRAKGATVDLTEKNPYLIPSSSVDFDMGVALAAFSSILCILCIVCAPWVFGFGSAPWCGATCAPWVFDFGSAPWRRATSYCTYGTYVQYDGC